MQFKWIFVFSVLLSATFSTQAQSGLDHPAMEPIKVGFEAYDALDATAFANTFTADAVMVNPAGMILRGKETILQSFSYWFSTEEATSYAGSSTDFRDVQVNELTPDLALISFIAHYYQGGKVMGTDAFIITCKKVGGKWNMLSAQATAVPTEMANN